MARYVFLSYLHYVMVKAVNFSQQSQLSRICGSAMNFWIMPRIAAIFANFGFRSGLREHSVVWGWHTSKNWTAYTPVKCWWSEGNSTPDPADFGLLQHSSFQNSQTLHWYVWVPCNSVAAEQSFSLYSDVLRDDRCSIKGENLAMYNMLYQNSGKL